MYPAKSFAERLIAERNFSCSLCRESGVNDICITTDRWMARNSPNCHRGIYEPGVYQWGRLILGFSNLIRLVFFCPDSHPDLGGKKFPGDNNMLSWIWVGFDRQEFSLWSKASVDSCLQLQIVSRITCSPLLTCASCRHSRCDRRLGGDHRDRGHRATITEC